MQIRVLLKLSCHSVIMFEPLKGRINALRSTGAPYMSRALLERAGYYFPNIFSCILDVC